MDGCQQSVVQVFLRRLQLRLRDDSALFCNRPQLLYVNDVFSPDQFSNCVPTSLCLENLIGCQFEWRVRFLSKCDVNLQIGHNIEKKIVEWKIIQNLKFCFLGRLGSTLPGFRIGSFLHPVAAPKIWELELRPLTENGIFFFFKFGRSE